MLSHGGLEAWRTREWQREGDASKTETTVRRCERGRGDKETGAKPARGQGNKETGGKKVQKPCMEDEGAGAGVL